MEKYLYAVYLFTKNSLNAHYMPGYILGFWDASVNKSDKILFPLRNTDNNDSIDKRNGPNQRKRRMSGMPGVVVSWGCVVETGVGLFTFPTPLLEPASVSCEAYFMWHCSGLLSNRFVSQFSQWELVTEIGKERMRVILHASFPASELLFQKLLLPSTTMGIKERSPTTS